MSDSLCNLKGILYTQNTYIDLQITSLYSSNQVVALSVFHELSINFLSVLLWIVCKFPLSLNDLTCSKSERHIRRIIITKTAPGRQADNKLILPVSVNNFAIHHTSFLRRIFQMKFKKETCDMISKS